MAMIYRMAIEGIPSGFVAMACKRFIQGQVQGASLEFRPSPAKLAAEARRLRDKALDHERLAALRLPKPESSDPPDPTPEERERAAARWAEARREITAAVDASAMPKRRRYEYQPPTSDELAASLDRLIKADPSFAARHVAARQKAAAPEPDPKEKGQ